MQQRPLFAPPPPPAPQNKEQAARRIYSVTELNRESRMLIESTFPLISVEGEISNFKHPVSGHFYFCLKDHESQIQAVMWKSSHRYMKWRPQNGMKVIVTGKVTLYEPGGQYQLDVAQMSPHGKGDLYAAFEQLKAKLLAEGLFDAKRKRPIPVLPRKIGIVTSRSGAAIQDILNILNRRYMNLQILIYPAKVQGEEAAPTLVEGIRALNRFNDIDVLIVARGGGSIEDLWPFNEEIVARAIIASRIPVISAVGHETDHTIADFAADLRAPTPSAAAELVIGKKSEFAERLVYLTKQMHSGLRGWVLHTRNRVNLLSQHRAIAGVPQRIHMFQQKVDEHETRVRKGLNAYQQIQMRRLMTAQQKFHAGQLRHLIEVKRSRLNESLAKMRHSLHLRVNAGRNAIARCHGKLESLSPLAVLERGYSITCDENGVILKDSAQTAARENIQVRLHRGRLKCEVKETE